jgi:hypothetical protein
MKSISQCWRQRGSCKLHFYYLTIYMEDDENTASRLIVFMKLISVYSENGSKAEGLNLHRRLDV